MEGRESFEISATVFDTRSGLSFECQIGLSDNSDNAVLGINDGNSPYLMLLHQAFTSFDIFAITTGDWGCPNEFVDLCGLGIHALCDY